MDRSGSKTNGHSSGTSAQPSSDLYKQLINNDMVKELDDIEAISQQISQHAEVLYNSWKTNGMTQGPQFKLSAAQAVSPSLDHSTNPLSQNLRERGGTLSPRPENGPQHSRQQQPHYNTLRTTSYNDNGRVLTTTFAHEGRPGDDPTQINSGYSHNSLERQHSGPYSHNSLERHNSVPNQRAASDSSSSPRQSTVSSPTSSTRESPARGSSITHITHPSSLSTDVGPLELLASPNLNGNLEELVTSFVSTDKAKQAARNTISSTIMRRLGSPNGSASPVRSPSPTSTLSYRGASPLRSPMLTNTARSVSSPEPTSPRTSSSVMFPTEMPIPIQSQNRTASAFSLNSDIHAPMQSIFSKAPSPSYPQPASPNPKTSLLHVSTDRDMVDTIPIPVKHIPIAISPSTSEGLKSPSVLQNVNKNPFQLAVSKPNSEHMQMPNLFDDFGVVKDPETSILSMRKKFEEAKARMALSMPAREGGVRPNSFTSMGRSLFDRDSDRMSSSPWGDDPSAFLLEQFRRRNKRRMEIPSAPHPELTPEQKQHISERSSSMQPGAPLRRMLPGGSVAERVLMFEKSPSAFGLDPVQVRSMPQRKEPTLTGTAITPWRSQMHDQLNKAQISAKKERIVPISKLESGPTPNQTSPSINTYPQPPPVFQPPAATFPRRTTQPSTTFRPPSLHLPGKEEIPKFYFPNGNPTGKPSAEAVCKKFADAFSKYKNNCVTNEELGQVLKVSGYPLFWKCPVFQAAGGDKAETISLLQLSKAWRRLVNNCHDEAAQFVSLLTQGARTHLVPEDMVPLIQDVVDTHPGLLFLKEATEFHSRYVHTVIARIFYEVNRSWSGKITVSELRRSKFLSTLRLLQDEDDINQVTDFFSYEHFYVIYCKFWELDKDHDLFIDREDLARHNDHALSTRMIERIFSGAVTRGSAQKEGRMSYTEFVWFLLSEEDKRHPTAIEYWFRCMDLDGDGVLSMYELEYFYEEQLQRMEQLGIETLPFDDCLCQMLDMIRPVKANNINLKDLKYCKMTPVFFDTFFNLEKYLDHEQRDPFATQRETDEDGNELSDWDRFAAEEYELLVAEEGNNEPMDDMCYEDGENPRMHVDDSLDSEMIQHDPPGPQP